MKILSIETSCDETACAIVENGRVLHANVIASQIPLHRKTGGVVPEVAAREHVVKIVPVIEHTLKVAKLSLAEIDAVAVTKGPGLLSSLLVGVNAAMSLSYLLKKPLIPVHHIEGHMYANWIVQEGTSSSPKFPAVVLTASGGHNELILWKGHGSYLFLGATRDDAAGEAFDKVARLLGLPYPGGPQIQKAALNGDPTRYPLPRAWLNDWDFSFSGLKTAVLRLVQGKRLTKKFVADVAASFQESVCEVLATKAANAEKKYKAKEVHLAGGVSANQHLREWTRKLLPAGVSLRYCSDIKLCTDNAAMIGAAAYFMYKKTPKKYKTWSPVKADPNVKIVSW